MKVLIACEESQAVTKAFRERGHKAYSCDLLPSSGGRPQWHIQGDAIEVIKSRKWDLVISFPPCTDLASSGAGSFFLKRITGEQEKSIYFFLDIWRLSNCVENPRNILSGGKYLQKHFPDIYEYANWIGFPKKFTQSIQPWQFGHGETKETWLWLTGLPPLKPTKIVKGREQRIWRMPPSKDRSILRSKTYTGVAKAMAEQWG